MKYLVLVFLLVALSQVSFAQTLNVYNDGGSDIVDLRVSLSSSGSWGANLLTGGPIPPGSTGPVFLPSSGNWDLAALFASNVLTEVFDIYVGPGATVTQQVDDVLPSGGGGGDDDEGCAASSNSDMGLGLVGLLGLVAVLRRRRKRFNMC